MKMYNGFLIPEHEKSDNGFECCMSAFTKKGCMNIMCKNCLFDEPRRNNLFYEWVTSRRPTNKDNKTMKQLREVLKEYYLEYVNNYLSVDVFAEHNRISRKHAVEIIKMGKLINNEDSTEENNLDDFIERQITHEIQSIQQDTE